MNFTVIAFLIFSLAGSTLTAASAAASNWTSNGPFGGTVADISTPGPAVIFAASPSLFRSTNQGIRWQRLSSNGPIRFHPSAPLRILTFSNGLAESTDQGLTWQELPGEFGGDELDFLDVQFHPENALTLSAVAHSFARQPFNYFRSTDGGSTWNLLPSNGIPGQFQTDAVLTIDPTNGNRQFLIIGGYRILRTVDGGIHWNPIFSRFNSGSLKDLVIDPRAPSNVYAAGIEGVFKSTDGGGSWFSVPCECDAIQIAIDPFDSRHLAAVGRDEENKGKRKAVASYDAGKTWFHLNLPQTQGYFSVAFDPFHRQRMMVGSASAGIFRSTNGGQSFAPSNRGLDELSCWSVAHDPSAAFHYLSVTQVGLFESLDAGRSWRKKILPFAARPLRAWIHPGNTRAWLLRTTSGIATSTDSGASWITQTTPKSIFIAWDPGNAKILYLSPGPGKVVRSTDMGATWRSVEGRLPATIIYTIEVSAANSNILYLGTEPRKVFVSNDAGKSWTERSKGLYNGGYGRIYQIALDPINTNIAYTIGEWHMDNEEFPVMFKTTDSGVSWSRMAWNIGSSYPQIAPHEVVINQAEPTQLFARELSRVYESTDRGTTWKAIGNSGLELYPYLGFLDLDFVPQSNTLVGGTDNGVFVIQP